MGSLKRMEKRRGDERRNERMGEGMRGKEREGWREKER